MTSQRWRTEKAMTRSIMPTGASEPEANEVISCRPLRFQRRDGAAASLRQLGGTGRLRRSGFSHPLQQTKTVRPSTTTLTGPPIESSGSSVTGQSLLPGDELSVLRSEELNRAAGGAAHVRLRGPAEVARGDARVQPGLGVQQHRPGGDDPLARLQAGDGPGSSRRTAGRAGPRRRRTSPASPRRRRPGASPCR